MSERKIKFYKDSCFYPLVYHNGLTIQKIIKNLKLFFSIDYPNLNEKRLILYDNKEIPDFDINLNLENFNLLSIDLNQVIKYRNLSILRQFFLQKFKISSGAEMFIPKSEIEKKENNEYLYKNVVCELTNYTLSEKTTDIIDFFIKNSNNSSGSIFQGIVLDDNEIPTEIGENTSFGISILTKKIRAAIDFQTFVLNNKHNSLDLKNEIIKEMCEVLSMDDPKNICLKLVNQFLLILDEESRKIYFDIDTIFKFNLSNENKVYPHPENEINTHSRVWSFGILIYFILIGEHVFKNDTAYENYIKKNYVLELNGDPKIQTIVKKCLELDINNRGTLKDCNAQIDEYIKNKKIVSNSKGDTR